MTRGLTVLLLLISTLCVVSTPAQTKIPPNHDRLKALKSIVIEAGETASDVQCFLCNIHVRGHVTGDIVTFGGSIFVDGRVDGDAVAFGGRIESNSNSKIFGDAVAIEAFVVGAAAERIATGQVGDAFAREPRTVTVSRFLAPWTKSKPKSLR